MTQTTRWRALLLLSSGVVVMLMGLVMAVSAHPATISGILSAASVNTTCTNCHEDAHAEWGETLSLQITRDVDLTSMPVINPLNDGMSNTSVELCTGCHFTDQSLDASAQSFSTRLDTTRARVYALRDNLELIHAANADWNPDAYHSDKPAAQRSAERIDTLLDFIEADGSWGFHHPAYTEEILTEAEALMARLLR